MRNYIKPPMLCTSFSESGKKAQKRFDNILNTKTKKTGFLEFAVTMLIILSMGTLVACSNSSATAIIGGSDGPTSIFVSGDTVKKTSEEYSQVYELANIWANAWMTRDGKARYDIMSDEMKAKFEEEQKLVNGSITWSIRWSSPWVTSYTISVEGNTATIRYKYTDSTTAVYEGYEQITIGEENGRAVVVSQNADYGDTI